MRIASTLLLVTPLLLTACGGGSATPEEETELGYSALGAGDYSGADEHFAKAIEALGDDRTDAWLDARLGQLRSQGALNPNAALSGLEQLAADMPDKATDRVYSDVADAMAQNEHFDESVAVLTVAKGRFPDSELLDRQVNAVGDMAKKSGKSGAMDALKGLGYAGD